MADLAHPASTNPLATLSSFVGRHDSDVMDALHKLSRVNGHPHDLHDIRAAAQVRQALEAVHGALLLLRESPEAEVSHLLLRAQQHYEACAEHGPSASATCKEAVKAIGRALHHLQEGLSLQRSAAAASFEAAAENLSTVIELARRWWLPDRQTR